MNGIIINGRVYKLTQHEDVSHSCETCPLHKRCWEDEVSDLCLTDLVFNASPNAYLERTDIKIEID